MYERHNVGEIKRAVVKEANEFKAVLGKGAKNETGKAQVGGEKATKTKHDYSNSHVDVEQRGMHNLEIPNAGDDYKARAKAQMKGYTSVEHEKTAHSKKFGNDKFGNAEFGDDEYVKNTADHAKKVASNRALSSKIGLTARECDGKEIDKQHETMFECKGLKNYFDDVKKFLSEGEEKTIRRFVCKRTKFVSEAHMLTRVPDSVKNEGERFEMKDCDGYGYLVEWHSGKPIVEKLVNQKDVISECDKIKKLYNFSLNESKVEQPVSEGQRRVMEDGKVGDMLNKVRGLIK